MVVFTNQHYNKYCFMAAECLHTDTPRKDVFAV